jgi:hypothetical protein
MDKFEMPDPFRLFSFLCDGALITLSSLMDTSLIMRRFLPHNGTGGTLFSS